MDYFASDNRFPWSDVRDVLPGRVQIDCYMTHFALTRPTQITLIDSTFTVTSLHQTGTAGTLESKNTPKADNLHNQKMISWKRMDLLRVDSARYMSKFKQDESKTIGLYDKNKTVYCI